MKYRIMMTKCQNQFWHKWKKNKPSNGLVLNCDITELQDPQKSAFLAFFLANKSKFRIFDKHSWITYSCAVKLSFSRYLLRGIEDVLLLSSFWGSRTDINTSSNFFHNRNNFLSHIFFLFRTFAKVIIPALKLIEVPIYASVPFGDLLVLHVEYGSFWCVFISAIKF